MYTVIQKTRRVVFFVFCFLWSGKNMQHHFLSFSVCKYSYPLLSFQMPDRLV